jgi:Tfp pilus assembly PilM family ATPase
MALSLTSKFSALTNRVPADVVALDCASNEVRALRMRKTGNTVALVAAEILQPVPVHDVMLDPDAGERKDIAVLALPARVRGKYAALLTAGTHAVMKMLRVPESFDTTNPAQLRTRLGLAADDDFRVGSCVIQPGGTRREARLLAAAVPDPVAQALLSLLPSAGLPAPRSIELSELAVLNAFKQDPEIGGKEQAIGLMHFDHDFSVIALFNEGALSQLRTFRVGAATILRKVGEALNVDPQTAAGVLLDGAFDISHMIEDDAREVRGQYVICRDFMERSENCRLEKLYISGSPALTRPFIASTHISEPLADWDVLAAYTAATGNEPVGASSGDDAWRWAACVGACLGVLERS